MGDQPTEPVTAQEVHPVKPDSFEIPRLYQVELLEEAKKRNIIIRAETGSGKTLVACELLIWTARQPKPTNQRDIQVFLVPTRPLVHQQAQFIQARSNLRVKAYAGDLQPELWNIEKWHSELNEIDVLVSTAKIFDDLISKGYWKFEDVSLLIFDEAHHCRKNHIYNQIMRSHYHRLAQDPQQRLPKILGITASPIWDYKNLERAEKDVRTLQSALAAQLYEVKKQVEDIAQYNFKPNETMVYYEPDPPFQPLTDPPWDRVNDLLQMHTNDRLISNFKAVYSELGIYAYMLSVVNWLTSLVTAENLKQVESSRLLDPTHQKEIKQIVEQINLSLKTEDIPEHQLSPKIISFNKILTDYMDKSEKRDFQCMVFVDRRLHAQLLPTLIERNARLKSSIRPVALVGHGSNPGDSMGFNMDSKAQNKTVEKLHSGESNLVVATNVAEEGLDFRTCNVVIRFDEITSWKGYIQSRGRARARDSDYVLMIPSGSGPKYLTFIGKEEELRSSVYDRPVDELIEEGEIESTPQLISTLPNGNKSILTYNAATSLLNDVCQLVPTDEFLPPPAPEYECQYSEGIYSYKLTLPPMAALLPSQRIFVGEPMASKKDAKRSAAFAACKVLRKLGVLNQHFLPHREDKTAQAQDANGIKLEDSGLPDQVESIVPNVFGDFRTSPELWIHQLTFPDDSPSGSSRMSLLCARRLHIPNGLRLFNHFENSKPLTIKFDTIKKIELEKNELAVMLKKLEAFTRVVLQGAVNRKAYEGKLYFLVAPLDDKCEIDWNLVEKPLIPLSSFDDFTNYPSILSPLRQLQSRLFDTFEFCPDLTDASLPSLVPTGPTMRDFSKKIKKFKSLGHFYKVVYDLKDAQYEGQPLIFLDATFAATNNLSESESISTEPSRILLPLSTCRGTHIPRFHWKMYSFIPSLTRILYDGCQANAFLEKFNLTDIHAPLAIKALTPPGVGVPWDYQTLETVGDAFLKLATSIHVYLTHLKKGEGDMSLLRSRSVDNAYLRCKAARADLPAFILSQRFRIDSFRDAQTEDGKALKNGKFSRKIPRRVLSDVVEALLGAGFLSGGVELGLKVGTALNLCFGGTTPWGQRELNLTFGNTTHDMLTSSEISKYERIERKVGYTFKNKLLLVQALTHRSANSFMTNCYEREEWLGDAVIDMWIVEHAYHTFTNATAEELTVARAKLVSNGSLGFLAIRKLGLPDVILHNSEAFTERCGEAIKEIEGFPTISEYYSNIDNLFVVFDPPKILNDVIEALVGALFVDSGFNLKPAYQALDIIFEDVIQGLSRLVTRDPLSRLLKMRDKYQCFELRRESSLEQIRDPENDGGPSISARVCRIMFHGEEVSVGRHRHSVSVAEQRAALEALKVLADEAPTGEAEGEWMWSRCKCKSQARLVNQEAAMSTQEPAADPAKAEPDHLPTFASLTGKKNKKKRARLVKALQAQAEAAALVHPAASPHHQSLENTNADNEDSVDKIHLGSLDDGLDDSGGPRVGLAKNNTDIQAEDNLLETNMEDTSDGINPDQSQTVMGDPGLMATDSCLNGHIGNGLKEDMKAESKKDMKDESKEDMKDESKKDIKDESKEDMKDESEKDVNESKEEIKDELKEGIKEESQDDLKDESMIGLGEDPKSVDDDQKNEFQAQESKKVKEEGDQADCGEAEKMAIDVDEAWEGKRQLGETASGEGVEMECSRKHKMGATGIVEVEVVEVDGEREESERKRRRTDAPPAARLGSPHPLPDEHDILVLQPIFNRPSTPSKPLDRPAAPASLPPQHPQPRSQNSCNA